MARGRLKVFTELDEMQKKVVMERSCGARGWAKIRPRNVGRKFAARRGNDARFQGFIKRFFAKEHGAPAGRKVDR